MGWYAIFVETGKEEEVKKHIMDAMNSGAAGTTFELLIAKREMQEKKGGMVTSVIKKMFPGYILLETEYIQDFYIRLKYHHIEHLFGILRCGSQFKEVGPEEILNIVYMTDSDGVIRSSDIIVDNNKIIVVNGPLMNYDGYIKKVDRRKHRVKLVFIFNGVMHDVDLTVNFIKEYDGNRGKEIPFYADLLYQDMNVNYMAKER